jgi:uncharacterized membrane protein YoaK (UPF0700 family)
MFKYVLQREVPRKVYLHWFLLSFLAGIVNAGGYTACGKFVTHVTGFATLFGASLAHHQVASSLTILTVPFYFLLGAMISAYFVDRRIYFREEPNYTAVMSLVCICLSSVALGGYFGFFEEFGKAFQIKEDYFFVAILGMSGGLQNAAITTASKSTVRSTHLTGLTTDLGIGIVRTLFMERRDRNKAMEKVAVWLRFGSFVSFVIGAGFGAFIFLKAKYLGFLFPAGIALYIMLAAKILNSAYEGVHSIVPLSASRVAQLKRLRNVTKNGRRPRKVA